MARLVDPSILRAPPGRGGRVPDQECLAGPRSEIEFHFPEDGTGILPL